MADIELVIKIPEELRSEIDDENYQSVISWFDTTLYCAIKDGIQFPKGHGRLIDADELTKQLETVANDEWNKQVGASKGLEDAIDIVDNEQTIIEADKSAESEASE